MNLHTLPPPSSPLPPALLPPTPPTATISTPTPKTTATKVTRISGEQEQKIIPLKEYRHY